MNSFGAELKLSVACLIIETGDTISGIKEFFLADLNYIFTQFIGIFMIDFSVLLSHSHNYSILYVSRSSLFPPKKIDIKIEILID